MAQDNDSSPLARIYRKHCICVTRDGKFVMGFNVRRGNSGLEYTIDLVSQKDLTKSTFKKTRDVKKVVQSEYMLRQMATV